MEIKNLSFAYGQDTPVLDGISFHLKKGHITTLIGANGSGKSTLLSLMSKNLPVQTGDITLGEQSIQRYSLKKFATQVAIVHQKNTAPGDLTVKKLVSYGRIPYTSILKSGQGDEKVDWALEVTGLKELANRPLRTLSGGQRQRAFIAMALAQDTKILFLDEPTTFLDVRYQVEILRLIRHLNQTFGITILMVLHDINQALAYSHEVIGLKDGTIRIQGKPADVISQETIADIYGIDLEVFPHNNAPCVLTI